MRPKRAGKILVVRAGALGDTLMVTPVLRALRRHSPEASIDFLCSAYAAPLVELNPNLTRIHRLHRRNLPYWLSVEKLRLTRLIRRGGGYDTAILLESAPRYRELLRRIGAGCIRSFVEVPFDPKEHCIVNNLRVAGIQGSGARDLDMDLPLDDSDRSVAERLLEGLPSPRVGVHVGYGPRKSKRLQSERLRGWNRDSFARLVRDLLDSGASVILTGSADDRTDTDAVSNGLESARLRSIVGRTRVRELAAVISHLNLLISVDSAPPHMAAALGTPVLVLWGPGIIEQTRPISSSTTIRIIRARVLCAPCYGTPSMKTCTENVCMGKITPGLVLDVAKAMLSGSASETRNGTVELQV